MKSKKIKFILITFLLFLEIISVYLTYKSHEYKDISNAKEENKVDKKKFSMYIENNTGSYEEYTTSEIFPSNLKYIINTDKSECTDIKGNIIENILTVNDNNLITISTNKTVYCYLYFDLETTKPVITTLYVGGSSNPTYTTTTSTTIYLTHADEDVESYCVIEESTSDNCEWINSSEKEITTSYTLASTDGVKTVNAYLKDLAGNISEVKSDTITLDSTYPTVTASASGNNTASPKITINSNETGTYCVNTSDTRTDMSNCTFSGSVTANTSLTTSAFSTDGDYYVHVKDAAGNIGISSKVTMQVSQSAGEYIQSAKPSGLNTALEGGLYRYQGTSPNNYICFGTSTKSTCTGNTDQYMYRIIGINESGQLKLIKKEALNSTMTWNSSTGVTWPNSGAYSSLNGSAFYTNTTYVPTSWQSKIAETSWKYGDITTYNTTASAVYTTESGWTSTVSNYIGLMYMHDYYYAYQSGGLNCSSDYSTCKTAWLHLSVNDSGAPSAHEWTMSRYDSTFAWFVLSNGYVNNYTMSDLSISVRPVFYLTSDVQFISGTGQSSDPFIVE